nr:type I 3-dehydroquinate dehydratase [uncultured Mediterraneibacter sp.]
MSEINTVNVRGVEIGAGIPKICIPVTGITEDEILEGAARAKDSGADLVEWRADWYEDILETGCMEKVLKSLRNALCDLPLLFTFRTGKEGGERNLSADPYTELNQKAIQTGNIDLVDVEISSGDASVREVISSARSSGVRVVASNHDFCGTPAGDEIIRRLRKMQESGADILKIAVMPENARDVLTLLDATETMREKYARRPVITMAMGGLGAVSRISGEIFGSALTFGTAGRASAPGQIEVGNLRAILECLHESLMN